jgi:hypothetical protein
MIKNVWKAFLVAQLVGLLGIVGIKILEESGLRVAAVAVAIVALFPGSLLGGWIIERAFRPGTITRETIASLAVVCAVGINIVMWFTAAVTVRLIRRRSHVASV